MANNTIPVRGHIPSIKLGEDVLVPYGSSIEADAIYFFEFKKSVNWYKPQPFKTKHRLSDGIIHSYTPDFEVHENDSQDRYIVECKPEAKVDEPHTKQQIQLGEIWAKENDASFVLLTDVDLRSGHVLSNIKLMWRYARIELPKPTQWEIEAILRTHHSGMPIWQLCGVIADENERPFGYRKYILHMMFHHLLEFDLNSQLCDETKVWLRKENR